MPSATHELIVDALRRDPDLAALMARQTADEAIPSGTARLQDPNLTVLAPTEHRADLVVLLGEPEPSLGIVVEVQLASDPDKPFRWPVYSAALRERIRCPTCVVVVTPHHSVARWAERAVIPGPRQRWAPLVFGPDQLPDVEAEDQIIRYPALALMSFIERARRRSPDVVDFAARLMRAYDKLDDWPKEAYYDTMLRSLDGSARAALERQMGLENYEWQTEFFRSRWDKSIQDQVEKLVPEKAAALAAEQVVNAVQTIVLKLLEKRGIEVGPIDRGRIAACTDIDALQGMAMRAASASDMNELWAEPGP